MIQGVLSPTTAHLPRVESTYKYSRSPYCAASKSEVTQGLNQRYHEPRGLVRPQICLPRLVNPFYSIRTLPHALYCTERGCVLRSAKMVVLKPGTAAIGGRTDQNGPLMSAGILGCGSLPFYHNHNYKLQLYNNIERNRCW